MVCVTGKQNGSTSEAAYTERLLRLSSSRIKRFLNVQLPYRWNIRRLVKGFVLDVGCGIGRNLEHLRGNGVGVDGNPSSIEVARSRGLTAFTIDEFFQSDFATRGRFDVFLLAHILEHLTVEDSVNLILSYLPFIRSGAPVIVICPQHRGFHSDPTHITNLSSEAIEMILRKCDLTVEGGRSFPLPRIFGSLFTHNETIVLARKP